MDREEPGIAVVDDDEAVRRALQRLLRSANYRAETFDSAASFLESLSRWMPQCLILDLQMPKMTGLELQQRLLQLDIAVPVIVITAHDDDDTRQRCLALGALRYLSKPVESSDLLEAIRAAVDPKVDSTRS